jgi:hypothetical protein
VWGSSDTDPTLKLKARRFVMRWLVGFVFVLALAAIGCGDGDGKCRGSLGEYCARRPCPTYEQAVSDAHVSEIGVACGEHRFVETGSLSRDTMFFDDTGRLVAVAGSEDIETFCDWTSRWIFYGPVPHCPDLRVCLPFANWACRSGCYATCDVGAFEVQP